MTCKTISETFTFGDEIYITTTNMESYNFSCLPNRIVRRGYIYGAVNGHRNVVFTAALQSLDGAKPKTNPDPNTNLTVILNTNPNTNPIR